MYEDRNKMWNSAMIDLGNTPFSICGICLPNVRYNIASIIQYLLALID